MKFFETMINHKLNRIQPHELMSLARQYNLTISADQAEKIAGLLYGKNINLFNPAERMQVLSQISAITGPESAKQIETIFNKLTSSL